MRKMRLCGKGYMTENSHPVTHGKPLKILSYVILCALGLVADQLTKFWAYTKLRPIGQIRLWDGVFHLTYRENTGAAFSILEGKIWFFSVVTGIIIVLICIVLGKGMLKNTVAEYSLLFVGIGGLGNLIDRIMRGFVVDMFDFTLINFAVFNVADIFITCGCALFICVFLFKKGDIFK